LWVAMGNAADVLMILMFSALLVFACWETQAGQSKGGPNVYHARVRPGGSAQPLPEVAEPAKP